MWKGLTYSNSFFAKLISCGCMFAFQVRKPICDFEGCVIKVWVTRVWMFILSSVHLKQNNRFPTTLWAAYSSNQGFQHQPQCSLWAHIWPSQKETSSLPGPSSLPGGCEPEVPKWENMIHLVSGPVTNSYSVALYISYPFLFFYSNSLYSYYSDFSVFYLFWNQMPLSFILSLPFEYLVASESWNMLSAFCSVHFLSLFISTKPVLASLSVIHLWGTDWHCCFWERMESSLTFWYSQETDNIALILFLISPAILNIRTTCFADDTAVTECLQLFSLFAVGAILAFFFGSWISWLLFFLVFFKSQYLG